MAFPFNLPFPPPIYLNYSSRVLPRRRYVLFGDYLSIDDVCFIGEVFPYLVGSLIN